MDDLGFVRVTGVSFYQEALSRCEAGEPVMIVHEPDNPHDETALKVVSRYGDTIGYVPRLSWVHEAIHQQGRGIAATIASIGLGRACLLGARLSVAICDDAVTVASHFPDCPAPEAPRGGFRYWIRPASGGGPLAAGQR